MTALIVIGAILLILIIFLNIPVRVRAAYYDKKLSYDVKYAAFTVIDSEKEDADTGEKKPKKPKKPKKDDKADEDAADSTDSGKPPDTEPSAADETSPNEPETSETVTDASSDDTGGDEKPADDKDKTAEKKKPKKHHSLIPREHLADKLIAKAEELSDKIDAVKLIIDLVWDDLIKLIKKVYFTGLVVDLGAANEDAAEAAIAYGRMNAVTYDAIATVKALTRLDVKSVRIDCLYDTPKDKAYYNGEITLRLRPASLVNALFAVLFRFLFHIKKYKPILDTFLKK